MPKSKSKRRRYQPPPKPKPPPSPPWVGWLVGILTVLGFVVILLRFITPASFFDASWPLAVGLVLLAGALGVATRWR